MTTYYNPQLITDGLLLCVDPANKKSYAGTGTSLYDISGNNRHVTFSSAPTFSSGSLSFAGNIYGTFSTANLPYSNSARTLTGWAKLTNSSSYRWIISYGNPVGNQGCYIGVYNNTPYFGSYGNDITAADIVTGQWVYYVGTYDGSTANFYINGTLAVSVAKSWNTVSNVAYISAQVNGSEYWYGNIAHVCLYNRALTSNEVAQNFQALRGRFGI